jgi:hypothetical protein
VDVFINTKPEDFVDCSEIRQMSLAPWTGETFLFINTKISFLGNMYVRCEDVKIKNAFSNLKIS